MAVLEALASYVSHWGHTILPTLFHIRCFILHRFTENTLKALNMRMSELIMENQKQIHRIMSITHH